MNSKFVVALRTTKHWFTPIDENELSNLIHQSDKLIKQCQKLILENTEIGKKHIIISFNEIEGQEPDYLDILKDVSLKIDELIKIRFLNEKQLEDLSKLERQRDNIGETLNICSDTKGYLIELLAAYFPELTKDEIILTKIRELLPVWNNTRRQIEARVKQKPSTPPPAADQEPGKEKSTPVLSIPQIALKSVYEGLQVTRENADEIVKKFGWNSGQKLYQWYLYYLYSENRTGEPESPTAKKVMNKIRLIESVIELLPEPNKLRAIRDMETLKILKIKFENRFD